jgi:hypothetical protein
MGWMQNQLPHNGVGPGEVLLQTKLLRGGVEVPENRRMIDKRGVRVNDHKIASRRS